MKKIFLFLLLISELCYGEIYEWVDAEGRVYYSSKPPANRKAERVNVDVGNTYKSTSTIDRATASKKVIMYSTSWCGYCKKARRYFRANRIPFTERDIEKSRRAKSQYDALGGNGVPLILVGKRRMSGFSVQRFKRIYQ